MSAESSSTPIHYAQQASRSRRLFRRFWVPAFLLLVLISAYWWGPPLFNRIQLSYWYDRCLSHAAPPNTVVYDATANPPTPYVPGDWQRFYSALSSPGFQSTGTAFLGGRRTPDGREVLVAVDIPESFQLGRTDQVMHAFHVRAFERTGLPNRPRQLSDSMFTLDLPSAARILAGHSDAKDPTHFTIPVQFANGTGAEIDGWAREDGILLQAGKDMPTQFIIQPPPKSPG